MKIFKRIVLSLIIAIIMVGLASCGIPNMIGNTNLQLLRIETSDNMAEVTNVKTYNRRKEKMRIDEHVEELDDDLVTLIAVVKNEERASFIDMVVYNSQNKKTVVYNEGNGTYQCSSETVFEDDMWVTNISFQIQSEIVAEEFYYEIKEIKFLENNVNTQVDLNTNEVRKKYFVFSDKALTKTLEQVCPPGFIGIQVETINLEDKVVALKNSGFLIQEKIETIYDKFLDISIEIPSEVEIKYYENRELKTDKFKVQSFTLEIEVVFDSNVSMPPATYYIKRLVISDTYSVNFSDFWAISSYELEYKEGTKRCAFNNVSCALIIPSSCEEIYGQLGCPYEYIKYNGTKEDFKKIKGVDELLSYTKGENVICNDGLFYEN